MLRLIQDGVQHVLLALPADHKGTPISVVDDRVGKGDPLVWGLGRVVQPGDPSVRLAQELMTGEERASVSIGTHPEEDEVKDGEPRRVLLGKEGDELFLVLVRQLVQVVEQGLVDRVDLFTRDGDVLQKGLVASPEVRVFVVERDDPFVTEEDFPRGRKATREVVSALKSIMQRFRVVRGNPPLFPMHALLSDQPLQVVGQTSSTEGQGELAPLVDGIVLSLDDKVGERVDEFAVVVERVEDGRCGRLRRHGATSRDWVGGWYVR